MGGLIQDPYVVAGAECNYKEPLSLFGGLLISVYFIDLCGHCVMFHSSLRGHCSEMECLMLSTPQISSDH